MLLLTSLFAFVVAIGVIVSFHEFGHFWVARRLGVKVLRYSVGFGKPLWRKVGADGTEYVIAALPLGGYVKMLDEHEGAVDPRELDQAFNRQPLGARAAIVAAGPVFNFILAVVLYYFMFLVGVSGVKPVVGEVAPGSVAEQAGLAPGDRFAEVGGEAVQSWQQTLFTLLDEAFAQKPFEVTVAGADGAERRLTVDATGINLLAEGNVLGRLGLKPVRPRLDAVIGEVLPGTVAAEAQLRAGDRIVLFDGEEVADWAELVRLTQARPGKDVVAEIARGGARFDVAIRVGATDRDGVTVGHLGVGPPEVSPEFRAQHVSFVRYGPFESLWLAAVKTWDVTVLSVEIIKRLLFGEASLKNVSGPVGIAEYAGFSLLQGLGAFLGLLAMLSVSIGLLNLLPVPILDGGQLLYHLIEFVKGSPLSPRTQLFGQWVGVFMLGGLMMLALYNDLNRLLG